MFTIRNFSWLALVSGAGALPWLDGQEAWLLAGTLVLFGGALGGTLGLLPILSAAAVTAVVAGGAAIWTGGDLRDPNLPECQYLMSGVGEDQEACLQMASGQAQAGLVPSAALLLLGLPAGLLRVAWDHGGRREAESETPTELGGPWDE